jgi:hypothetical protein
MPEKQVLVRKKVGFMVEGDSLISPDPISKPLGEYGIVI